MKPGTETDGMQPQGRGCLQVSEAGRDKEVYSGKGLGRSMALLTT